MLSEFRPKVENEPDYSSLVGEPDFAMAQWQLGDVKDLGTRNLVCALGWGDFFGEEDAVGDAGGRGLALAAAYLLNMFEALKICTMQQPDIRNCLKKNQWHALILRDRFWFISGCSFWEVAWHQSCIILIIRVWILRSLDIAQAALQAEAETFSAGKGREKMANS